MARATENGLDMLFFTKSVMVVEDPIDIKRIPKSVTVLRMVPGLAHPAHCILSRIRQSSQDNITEGCFSKDGSVLSSEFMDEYDTITDPAQTYTKNSLTFNYLFGIVTTLLCVKLSGYLKYLG